jgi:hypothetical protein
MPQNSPPIKMGSVDGYPNLTRKDGSTLAPSRASKPAGKTFMEMELEDMSGMISCCSGCSCGFL